MKVLPGRSLLLALLAPSLLGLAAIAEPNLVPVMLAVDLFIILVALLDLSLAWRSGVEVTREVTETVSLARPLQVTLHVRNLTRWKLRVQVQDALFEHAEAEGLPVSLEIPPRLGKETHYRLRPMMRGQQLLGAHHVRYPSPGGFWTRQVIIPAAHTLHVYPDVMAVRHYELLARQNRDIAASRLTKLKGGDTEFERLRDHLPDDEFRRIDWRATARRRRLTVREFQLEQNQNIIFMLDCGRMMTAVWDGLTALDYSLNATLMLAHVAVRRGDNVGLLAFDEKVTRLLKPRGGPSASNHVIQATYDLFPQMVESDYEGAFRTLRMQMRKRTLVVFITHAIDEETSRRIKTLARELLPQHLPLCVLLKDRALEARAQPTDIAAEAICIQAAAAEMLLWRDKVARELERAGVLVLDVLHHQLTGALVSRYLDIKARGLI